MKDFAKGFFAVLGFVVFLLVFLCLFDYFVNVGPARDAIAIQDTSAPKPKVWCAGDSMAWGDSLVIVEEGWLRYSGTIRNTCRYPAIISVVAKIAREDGVTSAGDDFFLAKDGQAVMPRETVAYTRVVRLNDDLAAQPFHVYNVHKYGSVSVDADPNAGSD